MTYAHPLAATVRALALLSAASLTGPAFAQAVEATEVVLEPTASAAQPAVAPILSASETALEQWLWTARPLIVFADSPLDPRFTEQMLLLEERLESLALRDVVIITDTDPAAQTSVRKALRPRGFALVLLAKDGSKVIRKPSPWSEREISRSIDKLPLRQQELRAQREAGG